MKDYDVIIVGAGPAGSTCAARLHQAGLRVKLFDKKRFPRVKPCAGWVTPQVIEALKVDAEEYQKDYTLQPITGFRTGVLGRKMIETNYQEPVSFGIRRCEFDTYLLQRSGVTCQHDPVKSIERRADRWQVNGAVTAPLLIGAAGHFCPVAKFARQTLARQTLARQTLARQTLARQTLARQQAALSSDQPSEQSECPVVYAQEVEYEMSNRQQHAAGLDAAKPELYFCPDFAGYGWVFCKGNWINIGLGRTDKNQLSTHVDQFCDFLRAENRLVDTIPQKFLGHAYRLYAERKPFLSEEGLILLGDAAGLAYRQSGEGIRPAVESAIIAADVVLQSDGNYDRQVLAKYDERVTERFGEAKSMRPVRWLPMAWLQGVAAMLMATQRFSRKTVIEDWFLHRKQATLLG